MMRLICPSCAAQYNLPDNAIPPAGREVQCSSCKKTWYQTAAGLTKAAAQPVAPAAVTPAATPARRAVDAAISDILREEAALDRRLRNTGPVASSTGMMIDADAQDTQAAKAADITADLRRRAQQVAKTGREKAAARRLQKRGFRAGFGTVLAVAALLLAPYVFSAQITDAFPQTTDLLSGYVTTIDQVRLRLNTQAATLFGWLNDATGAAAPAAQG